MHCKVTFDIMVKSDFFIDTNFPLVYNVSINKNQITQPKSF